MKTIPPCWGVCGPEAVALMSPDAGAKVHDEPDDPGLAMLRGLAGESEEVESC